jgi:hypothetical protein
MAADGVTAHMSEDPIRPMIPMSGLKDLLANVAKLAYDDIVNKICPINIWRIHR